MDNFILWGATGQAIVLEELLSSQKSKIVAFFENNFDVISPFTHIPIYYGNEGFEEWILNQKSKEKINFLVAIGGSHGNTRENIFRYLESSGLIPKTVIHPTAFVSYNAKLGRGCQVLAKSSICANVILGDSVIVNTGASVDHETLVGDFVHIAPSATICGSVNIGKNTFVGANATILPRIIIGENSIIGAGSVVTKDVPDNVLVYGNPAKFIKKMI